ncbi:MAG: H-NS family nucleoid-associated regulatory protein [Pseudomonadota bacterium]
MSSKITLTKKSVEDLLALRAKVDQEIAAKAAAEVAELEKRIKELKAFASAHKPVAAKKPKASKPARKTTRKAAKPKLKLVKAAPEAKAKKPKATKRKPIGKAPIKFRDPKTGNSWSGRGRTPVWLRNHEEAGRKRTKYAVAS